jgi:hypothetical protein
MHSHEEDTKDIAVYRRAGYKFPLSRGRKGFELREGGHLVYYGIARADGSERFSGRWIFEGEDRIRIEVDNERIIPFVLTIDYCDRNVLKVRR